MQKLNTVLGLMLLIASASAVAMATPVAAPEIPVGSAGSAIALVSGLVLLIRGRRK